jgi:hypothetical protein
MALMPNVVKLSLVGLTVVALAKPLYSTGALNPESSVKAIRSLL